MILSQINRRPLRKLPSTANRFHVGGTAGRCRHHRDFDGNVAARGATAARQTACLNNLAQLGLAMHNYEYAFEHFPPGVIDIKGPILSVPTGQHIGFLVQVLPFIEPQGIFEQFDQDAGTYAKINAAAREMVIPVFLCPSQGADLNTDETAGLSNYAGCHHGSEVPIDIDNNGMLFLNSKVTFGDIRDGSSNTFLLREAIQEPSTALGWASGTRASLRNSSEILPASTWLTSPLNSGMVADDFVGGFSSYHPGRSNFGMASGSVHSLRFSIDPVVLETLGNRADGAMMGDFL